EKVAALARLVSWAGHGPGGLDWAEIERQVGIALPASFKEYVSVFPPGTFQDYVVVAGPRSSTDAGYPERVQSGLRALRVLKHSTPGFTSSSFISIPYDVFPRIPGLFPWDWIGRDCVLCWHMVREGEDSPQVVLVDEGERRVVELPGDMVDCITDIITGRYPEFDYIAEEFDPPRFVPLKLPPADSGRAPRRTSDHADRHPPGLLTAPLSRADA